MVEMSPCGAFGLCARTIAAEGGLLELSCDA